MFNNKAAALTFITLFLLTVGVVKFPVYLFWLLLGFAIAVCIFFVAMLIYSMFEWILNRFGG
jgi:hypothetical protein